MTTGNALSPSPLQVALSFLNDVDNDCDNHYQIESLFITH
jgi:hypothetical protein